MSSVSFLTFVMDCFIFFQIKKKKFFVISYLMPELFRIKVQGFQVCRDYLDTFLSLLFVRFHFGQKKIH